MYEIDKVNRIKIRVGLLTDVLMSRGQRKDLRVETIFDKTSDYMLQTCVFQVLLPSLKGRYFQVYFKTFNGSSGATHSWPANYIEIKDVTSNGYVWCAEVVPKKVTTTLWEVK